MTSAKEEEIVRKDDFPAPCFESAAALRALIDDYFFRCEGKVLTDSEGAAVCDKTGRPIRTDVKAPSVAGLAYALGFVSRDAMLHYAGRRIFRFAIRRALLRIEAFAEENLFDKDSIAGAKFILSDGFLPKNDEVGQDGGVRIVDDV